LSWRQVDLRDAQQIALQQAELHQVDAVDLDLRGRDVAELQLDLGLLVWLDRGDLR
jgi:hypothetical protein